MTFALIKPSGWNPGDLVTHTHLNLFQAALVNAVDGMNGGTYTLGSDLTFEGALVSIQGGLEVSLSPLVIAASASLQIDGPVTQSGNTALSGDINVNSLGDININSGGDLGVKSGGFVTVFGGGNITWLSGSELEVHAGTIVTLDSDDMTMEGTLSVLDGGVIDLEGGATGARINVLSGAKIIGSAGGEIKVQDAEDLTINGSSFVWRSTMTPTYYDDTRWGPISAGTPTWCMINTASGGQLICPLPLKPGDTLTTVRVTLKGGASSGHGANAPASPPKVELISVSLLGLATVIRTVDDMSGAGNGPAYDASHTITLAGSGLPLLVGVDPLYVRIRSESGADAVNNTTVVTAIDGTGVARSYRGQNEVY